MVFQLLHFLVRHAPVMHPMMLWYRREAASPARCAARARLAGFPLMSGASLTPSITSGEEDEVSVGAWALGSGGGASPAQVRRGTCIVGTCSLVCANCQLGGEVCLRLPSRIGAFQLAVATPSPSEA